jgi:tRNA-dihydrouridine synthase 2
MYSGKLALAPMVRSGELPTRLMALKYGADLVWSPEIVDKKLIKCERFVNAALGTVDFLDTTNPGKKVGVSNLVFRTLPRAECGKLVFQVGTANADLAVRAARIVAGDVAGIDVNAGCPKPFLTHSGMGAALLSTPDLLVQILTSLVDEVGKPRNIPISVKIRLLDPNSSKPTVDLVDRLCKTGIAHVTLHCRTRDMRNRQPPIRDFLPEIAAVCRRHGVSFMVNGAMVNRYQCAKLQRDLGADVGCMIAEGAECNPTCFSSTPRVWRQVVTEYVETAIAVGNYYGNTKYVALNMVPGRLKVYRQIALAKLNEELLEIARAIGDEGDKVASRVLQKLELTAVDALPPASDLCDSHLSKAMARTATGADPAIVAAHVSTGTPNPVPSKKRKTITA